MLHLPRPYQDELVGSMLQRGQRILGMRRGEFLSKLTGRAGLRSHSQLLTTYERLAQAYGLDFRAFALQHTVLPYLMAFMSCQDKSQLLDHLVCVRGNYGPLAKQAVLGEDWMRRCPECVADELRVYGESYWHRAHQLSAVQFCVHHRVKLEWTSQALTQDAQLRPPHECALKVQPQAPNLSPELMWEIAHASANALWGTVRFDCECPRFGRRSTQQLTQMLEKDYGSSFLQSYGKSLTDPATSVWPLKALGIPMHDCGSLRRVIQHVLLERGGVDLASSLDSTKREPPAPRKWRELEQSVISTFAAEVARHIEQGTQVRLSDLYALAGVEFLRHGKKYQMPRLMAWIENFKHSPQSLRVSGGRRKK